MLVHKWAFETYWQAIFVKLQSFTAKALQPSFTCCSVTLTRCLVSLVSADNKSKSSSSSKNFILKDGLKKHKSKSENKQVDKLEELEKLRNSEKMMDAFLASTAPHNKETNKNERTKTIIKTIRVSQTIYFHTFIMHQWV